MLSFAKIDIYIFCFYDKSIVDHYEWTKGILYMLKLIYPKLFILPLLIPEKFRR